MSLVIKECTCSVACAVSIHLYHTEDMHANMMDGGCR